MSTLAELGQHPAKNWKLETRHILVEITVSCRKESDACTVEWMRHVTTSRYARQFSINRYAIRLRLLHSVAPLLRSVPASDGFATCTRYFHPPPAA